MRVLVTGARGFVGRHLVPALRARGHEVIEADRTPHPDVIPLDLGDALGVRGAVELARPDAIVHLAGQAFVPASLAAPAETFAVNAVGTLALLETLRAVRDDGIAPRLVVASSGDVYGAQPAAAYPVRETAPTLPRNPYAASKIAAEALAVAYARSFGVDAVVTRAFNHVGPGQDDRFAVPAFAGQLARIAAGETRTMLVGNLEAVRDVLDVRDVCEAYALLAEGRGDAGEIYNVASGTGTAMREVLRTLITIAGVPVEVREDPARMRPADVPIAVGDATKLREATGWAPRIPLPAALRAVYDDARARLGVSS